MPTPTGKASGRQLLVEGDKQQAMSELLQLSEPKMVVPDELEDAFIKANPGLSRSAMAVTCDSKRLSGVRICLSKEMQFRSCEEIDRRACQRKEVLMPPVRGG